MTTATMVRDAERFGWKESPTEYAAAMLDSVDGDLEDMARANLTERRVRPWTENGRARPSATERAS